MRVLVCGGRDFGDKAKTAEWDFVQKTLDVYLDKYGKDLVIINGAAKGADCASSMWALRNVVPFYEYHAEWDKYGKRAGYLRNQQMLDEGKPDLVIAFPGGHGTKMMVDIARKAGVPVEEVLYRGA
jgi:hypothetical protein